MSPAVERRGELHRIRLATPCNEYIGDQQGRGVILDLSGGGLRMQRLVPPGASRRLGRIQLEFELPKTNEVIWALGERCFDAVDVAPFGAVAEQPGTILQQTGVRLVACADRHARLLRDYVREMRRERQRHLFAEAALLLRSARRRPALTSLAGPLR